MMVQDMSLRGARFALPRHKKETQLTITSFLLSITCHLSPVFLKSVTIFQKFKISKDFSISKSKILARVSLCSSNFPSFQYKSAAF